MPVQFRRHPDLRLSELQGEGVVLHLGARRYFTVNETGLSLLGALQEPRSFEDLVSSLEREYEVSPADAATTTRAFLDRCLEANLLIEENG